MFRTWIFRLRLPWRRLRRTKSSSSSSAWQSRRLSIIKFSLNPNRMRKKVFFFFGFVSDFQRYYCIVFRRLYSRHRRQNRHKGNSKSILSLVRLHRFVCFWQVFNCSANIVAVVGRVRRYDKCVVFPYFLSYYIWLVFNVLTFQLLNPSRIWNAEK